MRGATVLCLCFCATLLLGEAVGRASSDEPAATRPSAANLAHLNWISSLDAAYLQAQRAGQPILVLVLDGSSPTRDRAIAGVESALTHEPPNTWLMVRLDTRQSNDAARALGVALAPAICALSADGTVVGVRQGPLDDQKLPRWIDSMLPMATNPQASEPRSPQQWLADLASQDAATRELAIRSLVKNRDVADQVVQTLFDGPMTARLAALDVLQQWTAPIDGIDPWSPSTMTAARRKSLETWARSGALASKSANATPSSTAATEMEIQLDALLNAPTDLEARAIREQMVHFGPTALPAIRQRIDAATSDAAKERLMALRYRLVASDRLAQAWPGGFDRLASNDPFVRRGAVDDLSQQVTADDSRLLVELFSNDDEFVRERSLRMLRSVGGAQCTSALIHLLDDPDPNVRAAVLKTLRENPDPSLAPDLARYARSEKDPDLIVHCIAVLQDIPGDEAVNCLKDLLSHPAWRVRAEACEAIHEKMQSDQKPGSMQIASLVASLSKCLKDPDNFVISQAAIALVSFKLPLANRAVFDAMEHNPSLALDVLNSVDRDPETAVLFLGPIRKLTSDPSPQIRASVIRAFCQFAPNEAGAELAAGLKDPDPTVRQAAATGLTTVLDQLFPKNSTFSTGNKVDVQQWVLDFIAGTQRPAWMATLKPDLEKMIVSPDEQTRVAAAVSLCALAGEAEAWPVLQKAADSELARGTEAAALPWLKWDRRKALWDHLVAITPDGQMPMLIEHFAAVPDPRAATPLWNILRDPPRDALLSSVHEALETVYELSDSRMRSMDRGQPQPPTAQLDKCLADANAMLQSGGELQKVEALCLLFTVSPEKAAPAARKIFDDKANSPPSLRADALQIILISQANQQSAEPIAAQAISDPAVRKIAVSYLALGSETISTIRDSVYLNSSIVFNADVSGSGEQLSPIIPVHVPAGMDVAALAQLLTDGDQDIAGYAGYLLAIQGDHRGLPPLMRAMEAHGLQDGEWATLVYRAITKLDDDSQTPTLQRIYESFNKQVWEVHQFYWTIRAMHGPNVLKLRKRIRDEIGMEQLQ